MPKQISHYKCLVISPSDVEDAREAIAQAIQDWNAHAGEGLGAKIEAVRWESHARPALGAAPQDIINKQIVDDCDFGIAIFWSRLGSATEHHASGSVEEIERLLAKGANVMVYFCVLPIPQSALKDNQYQKLQDVKTTFRERGLFANYTSTDELRRIAGLHINGNMTSLLLQQRAGGQPIPSQGTATAPTPDIRVKVDPVLFSRGASIVHAVKVEVQNHSPRDFFLASVTFQRADHSQIVFPRDFLTGDYLSSRKIEPGNSFDFIVDPIALEDNLAGQDPIAVLVRDKIDRHYRSLDGELANALKAALKRARG